MLDIQQAIKKTDLLLGSRKEILEFAELAVERTLRKHADLIHSLFRDNYDPQGLIANFKEQTMAWVLKGQPPGWFLLLTEEQQNSFIEYAKNDFEQETQAYLVDLKFQRIKSFWEEQG